MYLVSLVLLISTAAQALESGKERDFEDHHQRDAKKAVMFSKPEMNKLTPKPAWQSNPSAMKPPPEKRNPASANPLKVDLPAR